VIAFEKVTLQIFRARQFNKSYVLWIFSMFVPVTCHCGKSFRVREERIGQKGKCPGCGQTITVELPTDESRIEPIPELSDLWQENDVGDGVFPSDLIDTSEEPEPAETISAVVPPPISAPAMANSPEPLMPVMPPRSVQSPPSYRWVPTVRPTPDLPLRVTPVKVEMSFEDVFVLVFKVWMSLIFMSFGFGVVLGLGYLVFKSISEGHP
jgi:hypothetical protein